MLSSSLPIVTDVNVTPCFALSIIAASKPGVSREPAGPWGRVMSQTMGRPRTSGKLDMYPAADDGGSSDNYIEHRQAPGWRCHATVPPTIVSSTARLASVSGAVVSGSPAKTTRSASFPTAIVPLSASSKAARAGLTVYNFSASYGDNRRGSSG